MKVNFLIFSLSLLILCSCKKDDNGTTVVASDNTQPNILLIIADDLGKDASPGYTEGNTKPNTPNLQNLVGNGIIFDNLWSTPLCTPTRATILTGKYGVKTGITSVTDVISTNETSLQKFIDNATGKAYTNAVIGKWHLSRNVNNPNAMGVQHYAGLISGSVESYYKWPFTENGSPIDTINEYITTKLTDLAIDWVGEQNKPWFLWLAYNAPHTPFHLPPAHLHNQGNLPTDEASIDANPQPYFMAAIEAMDAEIGRLLQSIPANELNNTVIIFIGDNGSPGRVSQAPYNGRAKGTLYQGGINVPMIISGKGVTRQNTQENALFTTADLFATIADLCGTGTSQIHESTSLRPFFSSSAISSKPFTYSEVDGVNDNGYTIRSARYKLIVFSNGGQEFYDLQNDPYENNNLINGSLTADEITAKSALEAEADRIRN